MFTRQTPLIDAATLSRASSVVLNKPRKEFAPRSCLPNSSVALCIPNHWSREIRDASRRVKISPQHREFSSPSRASNVASEMVLERCLPNMRPSASLAEKPLQTDTHDSPITEGVLCATAQQLCSSFPFCSNCSTSSSNCCHHVCSSRNNHQRIPQLTDQQQTSTNVASTWTSLRCPSSDSAHTSPCLPHQQFTPRSSINQLSTSQYMISASPNRNQGDAATSLPTNTWLDSIIAEARDEIDRERLKHANSDGSLRSQVEASTRKRLSDSDDRDAHPRCISRKRSKAISLSAQLVGASSTLLDSNKHFLLVPLDVADLSNKNGGVLVQFVDGVTDSLGRADPIEDMDNLDQCEEISVGNSPSSSASPSFGESSSALEYSQCEERGILRRTKAISLAGMSHADIKNRKRQQNRAAAVRYRRKLKDKRCREKLEVESLEKNIKKLKVEADLLEDQILKLREIIFQSVTDRARHSIPSRIGV
uniref:BZIP domain-containing protein n=1 Tax=Parascaris univalens TaxID=6257 RepID=A0A915CKM7_PARUN